MSEYVCSAGRAVVLKATPKARVKARAYHVDDESLCEHNKIEPVRRSCA